MPDTPTPAPFNEDALAARVTSSVIGGLREVAQQNQQAAMAQQQQQQARQAQAQYAHQTAGDPIHNAVIKPYVEPALRQLSVEAQGARDMTGFYLKNPGMVRYMDAIEGQFNQMASQGQAFDRRTIANHYIGQNFDHFVQEHQAQLQRAAADGAVVGAPGVGRMPGRPDDLEAFKGLTLEQMEQRLGVTPRS